LLPFLLFYFILFASSESLTAPISLRQIACTNCLLHEAHAVLLVEVHEVCEALEQRLLKESLLELRNAYLLITVSSRINSFQALGADVEELGPM